jgi:hypothetical protein
LLSWNLQLDLYYEKQHGKLGTVLSQTWWFTPVIAALGKLRQEVLEFKASLGYITRSYLKTKSKEKENSGAVIKRRE